MPQWSVMTRHYVRVLTQLLFRVLNVLIQTLCNTYDRAKACRRSQMQHAAALQPSICEVPSTKTALWVWIVMYAIAVILVVILFSW